MLFLSLAAGTCSCVKDVVMDAKEKPQVVVSCILSDAPVQELKLFYSKGASLKEPVPVEEAEVVLIDKSLREEVGRFKKTGAGAWELPYAALPAHHYRLEVSVPGYELISAEDRMPSAPKMRAIGQFFYRIPGLKFPSIAPAVGVPEPFVPNAEDFDALPLGNKLYFVENLPDAVWIFARDFDPVTGRHVTVGELCTDYPADPFNLTGEVYNPPQRTDVPNPYVENSCVSKLYPRLEGAPLHRGYLRFPARDLTEQRGWFFSISGSMTGEYNCKDFYQFYYDDMGYVDPLLPDKGYLAVVVVTEDLDAYLLDAYHKQEIKASTDLSTIFLRDNLHTNIKGGLGIFGGMFEKKYQWSGEYEYVDDGVVHYYNPGPRWPVTYRPGVSWPPQHG